jgi:hypothetical protein
MLAATPWIEHFRQLEADAFRPLLDPADPIEHYCQVRDSLGLGPLRFETALRAPIGRNFPPTVVLRSLVLQKLKVPLILEWPAGIFPSVALQCQLALLLALAGEKEAAALLAEKLAPIVLGGFWTLWTLEKEYSEEETRLSCALFLQAIGCVEEADRLYSPTLPNSPFFAHLYRAGVQEGIAKLQFRAKSAILPPDSDFPLIAYGHQDMSSSGKREPTSKPSNLTREASFAIPSQIKIPLPIKPSEPIVWTLNGSKAGAGAMRLGSVRVLAFGPHGHPLTHSNLFGICEAGSKWFCSAAQKEVWFQVEANSSSFSLHSLGISFEKPMAFAFYVKAGECRIGERVFKPKSLQRFLGEASAVQFDGATLEIDRPLKIELIPLAGSQSFWGADFLLAFWLSPLSNKVFFRLQ